MVFWLRSIRRFENVLDLKEVEVGMRKIVTTRNFNTNKLWQRNQRQAEGLGIEAIEIILLIGAVVAIIARRFKIPYTVGLVVAGILLAFIPLGIRNSI